MNFDIKNPETPSSFITDLENSLTDFTFKKFPILSPKLFSLLPDEETKTTSNFFMKTNDEKFQPSLLSPNMLSFHKEGIFSLPTLFKVNTIYIGYL